jgi:uroporphyrinogen III methyltransferase/synthase
LVIYMGVSEIKSIVDRLLEGGMPHGTPVAAIERGTFPTQRAVTTTLSNLPGKVVELAMKPPTIFVIGEVVKLHKKLEWFRQKPLSGVRVMVTQPGDQAVTLYRDLREWGAEVLAYPTIATAADFRAAEWDTLAGIATDERWLLFTSENGVRYFLESWCARVGDLRGLSAYRIAAVGAKTVDALRTRGIVPDLVPTRATTAALVEQVAENLQGSKALVIRIRGNLGDDYVEKSLQRIGAAVLPLHLYRTTYTEWPAEAKEELLTYPPDVIIFTSSSAVDGFAANLDGHDLERLATGATVVLDGHELERLATGATVVSIGPSTSKTIQSYGMMVHLESRKRTTQSIVHELLAYYQAVSLTTN